MDVGIVVLVDGWKMFVDVFNGIILMGFMFEDIKNVIEIVGNFKFI